MSVTSLDELFQAEHAQLIEAANDVVSVLKGLRLRLRHGSDHYAEHTEYAQRCASLGDYVGSAVEVARQGHYGPALALIRSALEHHCFDRLLFLGNRYRRVVGDVDESGWREFEAANKRSGKWLGNIQSATWAADKKALRIVFRGVNVRAEDGTIVRQISPYYRFIDSYRAFGGGQQDQVGLLRHLVGPSVHVRFARDRVQEWRGWLVWRALQENLRLNGLHTSHELLHLRIHYSFLSTFTHPESDTHVELHGSRFGDAAYDHYSSELVLLYACALGSREIDDFLTRSHRAPTIEVDEEDFVKAVARTARERSAHLWFPGDQPHTMDRVRDANDRLWRRKPVMVNYGFAPPPELRPSLIRADASPLARLVALHRDDREIVGYSYMSPWPRADAWHR